MNHFLAQFFMAFQVRCLFVASVGSKNHTQTDWIFSSPIKSIRFMVFKAKTGNKKDHTTWKAMKSRPENDILSCV